MYQIYKVTNSFTGLGYIGSTNIERNKSVPLYDYCCHGCNITEETFHKLAEDGPNCASCGEPMTKLLSAGHGGFQSTEPTWLRGEGGRQVRECLQDSARLAAGLDKPIENRKDWEKAMKDTNSVPIG